MIYCNLKGGLANMLIQMAAVKSMAIDKGTDCSFTNLGEQLKLINDEMLHNPKIKHAFEYMLIFDKVNTILPTTELSVVNFPFDYKKVDLPDGSFYVDGFFQSEKYFEHNRKELLEWFKIPEQIKEKIVVKYSELFKQRTTSVHVRRGDYVRLPNHHPVQTLEYYNKSIEYLKDSTDLFIIFSDDIEWCKENFKNLDNTIYIEAEKDYIEIYLMSLCDNNIISNSSFSWWGAWLNEKENKIVIGPKIWFGPEIQHNTSDILPEKWVKF
jgi:hypothetical protein